MRRHHRLIPLFAAVLFCYASALHALALSDIRTAIRRNIRDTASATALQRYTDAMITAVANEGQRDVVINTWVLQDKTSLTVSSDLSSALPSTVIRVYRLTCDGANIPELTFDQQDADQDNASWSSNTGTATYFIQDHTRRSGSTNLQMTLTIVPTPSPAVSACSVYYYATATDLSADADIPFNSYSWLVPYNDLLVYYGTYRILYIEGMWDKARVFKDLYDTRLQLLYEDYGVKAQKVPAVPTKEQKP